MASTDRQNRLLLAEDWKRVYQSFRYANFQSYDFDNLRRTMINYIRENYPEDFNDYIESSEYLALVDLIAFLGQNISFRTDLNARENYIELAERRESVLRLARLISYNPKRNVPANGLLKLESVSTSEDVIDSFNNNLSNQVITWNDSTNPNWYEQFTKILNAALPVKNEIGSPIKKATLVGVATEQYRFNSIGNGVPVYGFTKSIDNISRQFEIVSTSFNDTTITEEEPLPGNRLSFIYRDNGQGSGSNNTGFFVHFRQGNLQSNDFKITNSTPNTTVSVDSENINSTDLWLYSLDSNATESKLWTKVDSIEGNNIIYNSLTKGVKDVYSVLTGLNDSVSLIFSDGTFGTIPNGNFRTYYRTSSNASYSIVPADMTAINVTIPYISKKGKSETISLIFDLKESVENASASESTENIKSRAPSTYYTQNRLITGEDYNVGPLSVSQEIVKTKSVNRTSSGISRYFDLKDATGKYSNTNLYGNDGIIYRDEYTIKDTFTFTTKNDIEGVINNKLISIIRDTRLKNFYYTNFSRNSSVAGFNFNWKSETNQTNMSTGYFEDTNNTAVAVGSFTAGIMRFIEPGSLVKFIPPTGQHFMKNNEHGLMPGTADHANSVMYKWSKIVSVTDNGTLTNTTTGLGPITLNDTIPSEAQVAEIIPNLTGTFTADLINQLVDQIFAYKTFGSRYDTETRQWKLITNQNLNIKDDFSLSSAGNTSNQQVDSSWLLLFETDGETYDVSYRSLRYVFESKEEIKFYFDGNDKIYDSKTGKVIKDKISVLSINTKPDSLSNFTIDWDWEVSSDYRESQGYVESNKIEVGFFDEDDDGVVDDPDMFTEIVDPTTNAITKYVFHKKGPGDEVYKYVDTSVETINVITSDGSIGAFSQYADGTVFYNTTTKLFKILNKTANTLDFTSIYKANEGRSGIKFQYVHAANENRRLDPSVSNIIDVYLLTRSYDINFRKWLTGETATKPLPPSNDNLLLTFGADINAIKSISDEVVYHPVKYKVLFGEKAPNELQAKFKVVLNTERVVNENEIKSKIVDAIDAFFSLENWDFGEKFYFTELATYVSKELSPDISSIVLIPQQKDQSFGSLFEINSESDEIFVSGANVSDIEIIDAITASRLQASGNVVTDASGSATGVLSSATTSTVFINSSTTSGTSSPSYNSGSGGSGSGGSGSGGSGSGGSGGGGSGGGGYGY